MATAAETPKPRSKHQEFMHRLSTSGRPLAQIQTEWHEYYTRLPDDEKHAVWQEFYAANAKHPSAYQKVAPQAAHHPATMLPAPSMPLDAELPAHSVVVSDHHPTSGFAATRRSAGSIKKHIGQKVHSRSTAGQKAKQHFQSLIFGLSLGFVTLIIFLFSFFNQMIIAPFIQPGRASATPIILDANGPAPTAEPQIIIPKINAQLPVDYNLLSSDEKLIQKSLEAGAIHYPQTAVPGQQGNAAYFAHSSNNIFNKGKYKFAFALLNELVPGDIFYVTYNQRVFTYKVFDKQVVNPGDTWVLGSVPGKIATAALITCDPPGTTLHRLVVWGEQITPDPATNSEAPAPVAAGSTEHLPGDAPSLWSRVWNWITPW